MHRGKGLKFVGDSRVLAPSERKKITLNTLVKQRRFGLTSF